VAIKSKGRDAGWKPYLIATGTWSEVAVRQVELLYAEGTAGVSRCPTNVGARERCTRARDAWVLETRCVDSPCVVLLLYEGILRRHDGCSGRWDDEMHGTVAAWSGGGGKVKRLVKNRRSAFGEERKASASKTR
jgi:hypothetical protein